MQRMETGVCLTVTPKWLILVILGFTGLQSLFLKQMQAIPLNYKVHFSPGHFETLCPELADKK